MAFRVAWSKVLPISSNSVWAMKVPSSAPSFSSTSSIERICSSSSFGSSLSLVPMNVKPSGAGGPSPRVTSRNLSPNEER